MPPVMTAVIVAAVVVVVLAAIWRAAVNIVNDLDDTR